MSALSNCLHGDQPVFWASRSSEFDLRLHMRHGDIGLAKDLKRWALWDIDHGYLEVTCGGTVLQVLPLRLLSVTLAVCIDAHWSSHVYCAYTAWYITQHRKRWSRKTTPDPAVDIPNMTPSPQNVTGSVNDVSRFLQEEELEALYNVLVDKRSTVGRQPPFVILSSFNQLLVELRLLMHTWVKFVSPSNAESWSTLLHIGPTPKHHKSWN